MENIYIAKAGRVEEVKIEKETQKQLKYLYEGMILKTINKQELPKVEKLGPAIIVISADRQEAIRIYIQKIHEQIIFEDNKVSKMKEFRDSMIELQQR
jgi:hypothetical protein